MAIDRKHYTEVKHLALEKARLRMRAVAARKAQEKVNIRFHGDQRDKPRADKGCQELHGVTFAMFCKAAWESFLAVTPRPPRRKKIEEMDARELFFEQFPEQERLIAETALAMSAHMEPGELMTTKDIMDAYEAPLETRGRAECSAVGRVMAKLQWARVRVGSGGRLDNGAPKQVWAYRKPANALVPPPEGR